VARILLGVTGSVAAIRTLPLFRAIRDAGHEARVVATESSLHFFDPTELDPGGLVRDADEWPASGYRRDDPVLHIELRRWADLLVVAPLDANTLAKFALGLSDNCLTCVFRAWDFAKPVVLAPAMNTLMWESPVTRRHLAQILDDRGDGLAPERWTLADADQIFAFHAPGIILVRPQAKRLACGDVGLGAMAEVASIAEVVRTSLDA
jgi:phosphopantothenoylcysteine decarboxylase